MPAKVSMRISSFATTGPLCSAKFMVFIVCFPKFHTYSCVAVAFLSESNNRVTITGRYLRYSPDASHPKVKRYSDVDDTSAVAENDPVKKRREYVLVSLTCQGAVELWAIKASVNYKDGALRQYPYRCK